MSFAIPTSCRLTRGGRRHVSHSGKRTALPPFPPQRTIRASFPKYSSGFAEAPCVDAGLVPHGTRPARTSYRWVPQHWEQGAELPCDGLFQAALQTSLRYWPAPATTSRKSAPFRAGAKFEPLSGPLQPGVRFLRVLLPTPPPAFLAGHLPRLRYTEVTAKDRAYHGGTFPILPVRHSDEPIRLAPVYSPTAP